MFLKIKPILLSLIIVKCLRIELVKCSIKINSYNALYLMGNSIINPTDIKRDNNFNISKVYKKQTPPHQTTGGVG